MHVMTYNAAPKSIIIFRSDRNKNQRNNFLKYSLVSNSLRLWAHFSILLLERFQIEMENNQSNKIIFQKCYQRRDHGILKHTNFHWTVAMKSYSYIIALNSSPKLNSYSFSLLPSNENL